MLSIFLGSTLPAFGKQIFALGESTPVFSLFGSTIVFFPFQKARYASREEKNLLENVKEEHNPQTPKCVQKREKIELRMRRTHDM